MTCPKNAIREINTDGKVCADDNGHDDAVDGDGLAEDDADEVLGLDARRLHAPASDARPSRVDSPARKIVLIIAQSIMFSKDN